MTRNISTHEDPIQTLRNDAPENYEQFLLVALYKNAELRTACEPFLCVNTRTKALLNDFQYPLHYTIYLLIKCWRNNCPEEEIDDAALYSILLGLSTQSHLYVTQDNVSEVANEFRAMMAATDGIIAYAMVKNTWRTWLNERRGVRAGSAICKAGGDEIATREIIADLNENRAAILNGENNRPKLTKLGSWRTRTQEATKRFPLGAALGQINRDLGGGFGTQEHVLFIAPTGGGKTVMACQIAAMLASSGVPVLYVTTEQGEHELWPRFISCLSADMVSHCKIPFAALNENPSMDGSKFTDRQREVADKLESTLAPYLFIADWTGDELDANGDPLPKKEVTADMDEYVKEWLESIKELGCDTGVVILDWIGGALQADIPANKDIRLIFKEAATKMKDVAKQFNVATISFAQATPTSHKSKLDARDMAECKSLHFEATAAFAISAVVGTEESSDSYSDDQLLNCYKSRKAKPHVSKLKRDFDFQRFICT